MVIKASIRRRLGGKAPPGSKASRRLAAHAYGVRLKCKSSPRRRSGGERRKEGPRRRLGPLAVLGCWLKREAAGPDPSPRERRGKRRGRRPKSQRLTLNPRRRRRPLQSIPVALYSVAQSHSGEGGGSEEAGGRGRPDCRREGLGGGGPSQEGEVGSPPPGGRASPPPGEGEGEGERRRTSREGEGGAVRLCGAPLISTSGGQAGSRVQSGSRGSQDPLRP